MLAWRIYGPILHTGEGKRGNPMKALRCVGGAYFLLGVLVPVRQLQSSGGMGTFDLTGMINASIGGAPLINVLCTMYLHPPETKVNPLLWLGYVITAGGAAMVFYFKPKG